MGLPGVDTLTSGMRQVSKYRHRLELEDTGALSAKPQNSGNEELEDAQRDQTGRGDGGLAGQPKHRDPVGLLGGLGEARWAPESDEIGWLLSERWMLRGARRSHRLTG